MVEKFADITLAEEVPNMTIKFLHVRFDFISLSIKAITNLFAHKTEQTTRLEDTVDFLEDG